MNQTRSQRLRHRCLLAPQSLAGHTLRRLWTDLALATSMYLDPDTDIGTSIPDVPGSCTRVSGSLAASRPTS